MGLLPGNASCSTVGSMTWGHSVRARGPSWQRESRKGDNQLPSLLKKRIRIYQEEKMGRLLLLVIVGGLGVAFLAGAGSHQRGPLNVGPARVEAMPLFSRQ